VLTSLFVLKIILILIILVVCVVYVVIVRRKTGRLTRALDTVVAIMGIVLPLVVWFWDDVESFHQSTIPVEDVLEISGWGSPFPIVSETTDFRDMSPTEVRGLFETVESDGYTRSLLRDPYLHPQKWRFLMDTGLSLRYDSDNDEDIIIHLPINVRVTREEVPEHVDIIDLRLSVGAVGINRSFESVILHNQSAVSSDDQSYTVPIDDTHPEIDYYWLDNEESHEEYSIAIRSDL
jgi:hypothetical protein